MSEVTALSKSTGNRTVRILAITDEVDSRLYGTSIRDVAGEVDLVVSCGDLPPYYIEYVGSMLNVPVVGVHGNHDRRPERGEARTTSTYDGLIHLHARVVREHGLLIGGFDGSVRYSDGAYQYTQQDMRLEIARMIPSLLLNRLRYGRYLDLLVTHAPPAGIHDKPDLPHQGFEAYRWFLEKFQPRYHLHGHVHVYDRREVTHTRFGRTSVLNVYPFRRLEVDPDSLGLGLPSVDRAA